jgi:hypothetical protein
MPETAPPVIVTLKNSAPLTLPFRVMLMAWDTGVCEFARALKLSEVGDATNDGPLGSLPPPPPQPNRTAAARKMNASLYRPTRRPRAIMLFSLLGMIKFPLLASLPMGSVLSFFSAPRNTVHETGIMQLA